MVDQLTPNHEYKFRVSAVNEEGKSEPLETLEKIIAKEPYDPPGKTGKPEITDWSKNHADLKWNPPVNDGGSPIEEYIIEVKKKFSPNWKPIITITAPDDENNKNPIEARVNDLIPGEQYEFRIVAKNKAGNSTPSDSSDIMTAKDRHGNLILIVSYNML